MRYALIRSMDTTNTDSIGVSLFVQGCHFHCKGCWNSDTWDFNGGKEFTDEVFNKLVEIWKLPYVETFSVLGGEPLHLKNRDMVTKILSKFKELYPEKRTFLWTGFLYEDVKDLDVMKYVDVLIEGQYIEELRNLNLELRGSENQRIFYLREKYFE